MNRTALPSIASFSVAVIGMGMILSTAVGSLAASAPTPAAAETLEATASPTYSADELRESFSITGFTVDQAYTWDWLWPQVTSFKVRDSNHSRVLMVLVYADGTAAQAARAQAEAREALHNPTAARPTGSPHLIEGFGPSVWAGNVAVVETTEAELNRQYQREIDRADPLKVNATDTLAPDRSEVAVDADFMQALTRPATVLL